VVRDRRRKISKVVLRYLLDKRIIKGHLYTVYADTSTKKENRNLMEVNVVEDVNAKLIEMYESV